MAKSEKNKKKEAENPEDVKDVEKQAAAKETAEPTEGKAEEKPVGDEEKEKLREQLERTSDILLRTAAEFDNYKKRTERERLATSEYAKAQIMKKLLPCVDNYERSLAADKDGADYAKGLEMIVKQLCDALTAAGLTEIDALGKTFDPNLHEAVMHVEDEAKGEKEITAVLQKGYKLGDSVIRPAMVTVAN